LIDKVMGGVVYAVMSFGDFLGIGGKYHPLAWSVLKYDDSKGGYVVDLDKRAGRLPARAGRCFLGRIRAPKTCRSA
jgi:hypothetical protein